METPPSFLKAASIAKWPKGGVCANKMLIQRTDFSPASPAPPCSRSECSFLFSFSDCSILSCHHLLPMSCDTNARCRQSAMTTWPSSLVALSGSMLSAASTPQLKEPSRSSTCSTMFTHALTFWQTLGRTLMYTRSEAGTLPSRNIAYWCKFVVNKKAWKEEVLLLLWRSGSAAVMH